MSKSPQYEPWQASIFRAHPVVNRPPKRHTEIHKGQTFHPHGTDSVGVIVSDPKRNRRSIEFRYQHDPDTLHSMPAHEFHDRFCLMGPYKPWNRQIQRAVNSVIETAAAARMGAARVIYMAGVAA